MNVIYDLTGFQSREHGERGIARYVLNLALALEEAAPGLVTEFLIDPTQPMAAGAEELIATGRVTRRDRATAARAPSSGGIFLSAGSVFESFTSESSELVLPYWARTGQWATVGVLYDLIPAIFPEFYLTQPATRTYYTARLNTLSMFDRLLAISQASADDACDLLGLQPSRIAVIGAGANSHFRRPDVSSEEIASQLVAAEEVPGLKAGFVLVPTGIDARKNNDRMIEAYAMLDPELRAKHQLVMTCRVNDAERTTLEDKARDLGIEDGGFLLTGYVSDDNLRRLYQGATLVIFPSLYEGFGLPPLEAMMCGAPVVCADSSSLKEVQPLAAARFDPTRVEAIAAMAEMALQDETFRAVLRSQEIPDYSWENSALATVSVIESLKADLEAKPHLRTKHRRLALFSPLPPEESGIATYADRMVTELAQLCDVTVFVDNDAIERIPAPEGVTVEPISRFEAIIRSGGEFDARLYFVGNSHFHVEMYQVLTRYPGSVVLHDVRLTGLYQSLHHMAPEMLVDGSVGATLATLYPDRYRTQVEDLDVIPPDTADRFGILMAREVAAMADQLFVHSQFAANLVALDTPHQPENIFALPCPQVREEDVRPAQPGPPTIASFGLVSPSKQPSKLLAALQFVHERCPEARLRFFGPIDDNLRTVLIGEARELGLQRFVDFPGHLDEADFAASQREATVAVQLRAFTNGESSAAVSELLAIGVPTVVSEIGAMRELPDDAVAKVSVEVTPQELAEAILELITDTAVREQMGKAARTFAADNSFASAAEALFDALFED